LNSKAKVLSAKAEKKQFTAPILVIASYYLNTSFSIKHLLDIDPDISNTNTIASVGSFIESSFGVVKFFTFC
jgi:hypothetical protein